MEEKEKEDPKKEVKEDEKKEEGEVCEKEEYVGHEVDVTNLRCIERDIFDKENFDNKDEEFFEFYLPFHMVS
jgi:hypothetical protein